VRTSPEYDRGAIGGTVRVWEEWGSGNREDRSRGVGQWGSREVKGK